MSFHDVARLGCDRDRQGVGGAAGRDGEVNWRWARFRRTPDMAIERGDSGDGAAGGAAGVGLFGDEEIGEGGEEEVGWAFES